MGQRIRTIGNMATMNTHQRGGRSQYTESELDTSTWPAAELPKGASSDEIEFFNKRKAAITMYARGDGISKIVKKTGMFRQAIHQLFNRCMEHHEDGEIYGFRAILPNANRKPYERKDNSVTGAGSFQCFIKAHPVIDQQMRAAVFGWEDSLLSTNKISNQAFFEFFIELCRNAGVKEDINPEYPFNTQYYGKRSFDKYLLDLKNSEEGMMVYGDRNARRHLDQKGEVKNFFYNITRPYQRVLFDGHSVDASWIIYFRDDKGRCCEEVLERFWLLLCHDRFSDTIIGRSISIYAKENYNRLDVIRAFQDSVCPSRQVIRTPINLIKPGAVNTYRITSDQAFDFSLIEEISYDNSKSNLAEDVRHTLKRMGCRVNAGPVGVPESRAVLERLFRTLEEAGCRLLPGSLGVDEKDTRRETAKETVKKFRVSFEILLYCLDKSIEWYNNRPRQGGFYKSPVQILKSYYDNEMNIIPKVLPDRRAEYLKLGVRFRPTVRGVRKTGTRPYVQFLNGTYTNPTLSKSWDLIGSKITCYLQEDAREADAYGPTGSGLGMLKVSGSWSSYFHTYEMRVLALKGKVLQVRPQKGNLRPGLEINMALKSGISTKAARVLQATHVDTAFRPPDETSSKPVIVVEEDENDLLAGYECKGILLEVDDDHE